MKITPAKSTLKIDYVIGTCYKSYLIIIKHLKKMVNSTDTDLHALLEEINKGLSDLHTFNSALHYASSVSAIHLGEALLK